MQKLKTVDIHVTTLLVQVLNRAHQMANSLGDFGICTINQTGIVTCVKHLCNRQLTVVLFV